MVHSQDSNLRHGNCKSVALPIEKLHHKAKHELNSGLSEQTAAKAMLSRSIAHIKQLFQWPYFMFTQITGGPMKIFNKISKNCRNSIFCRQMHSLKSNQWHRSTKDNEY